jgi:hypothetical protein
VERFIAGPRLPYLLAGEAGDAGGVADLSGLVVPPGVLPGDAVVVSPALRSQPDSDNVAAIRTAAAQAVVLRVLMAGSLRRFLLRRS